MSDMTQQAAPTPLGLQLPVFDAGSDRFTGGQPVRLRPDPDTLPDFVHGLVDTPVGPVPRVTARLTWADRVGAWKARWDIERMNFRVDPGLYALGDPRPDAPVLVSANYKMSFDRLRAALAGRAVWILVLDTGGVNVWCAAGKGTFGTDELLARMRICDLARAVRGRTLILPQLGAPGVSAHRVARATGFEVVFGPVRAEDLPAYLDAGLRARPAMRQVRFDLRDRAAVMPVELVAALRRGLPLFLPLFFVAGLGWGADWSAATLAHGPLAVWFFLCTILAGAVATPLFLPYLPGLAFSTKGQSALLLLLGLSASLWWPARPDLAALLELLGLGSLGLALAGFLAMNFTGASTYTSLSGVRREMRRAVPVQVALAALGLLCSVLARLAG